jgi:hypothetical protein
VIWPKAMRLLNRRQARRMHRVARQAAATSGPRAVEAMGPLREYVLDLLDGLPPTTFRCATCGRALYSYQPAADGRSFTARHRGVGLAHLDCPEHGPVELVDLADWRAEWTRRGRPPHLNWRLRPLG